MLARSIVASAGCGGFVCTLPAKPWAKRRVEVGSLQDGVTLARMGSRQWMGKDGPGWRQHQSREMGRSCRTSEPHSEVVGFPAVYSNRARTLPHSPSENNSKNKPSTALRQHVRKFARLSHSAIRQVLPAIAGSRRAQDRGIGRMEQALMR